MINPLFLPENSKRSKIKNLQQNDKKNNNKKQYKMIHQIDCIYQGQVNSSYQRQGFGIQQSNDFQMYIGFWKYGKANGIGMIIYPEGGTIYGYFKQNQIQGVAIVDNKKKLRIGIYKNKQIVGVGYEYSYIQYKWKLCKFHKGIPIQTLSMVQSPIQNGIPSLMNLHQDMYILLSKYLNEQFFDIPYKNLIQKPYRPYTQMNVHQINNSYLYLGQIIQGKYWGLGMIYDKKNGYTIQTGYYQMGQLDGYGLKIDKQKNTLQIGLYNKGKKQGFFYQRTNNIQIIVQYQKNYCKGEHPQFNKQKIKNNQKIFNYQKNNFFSQKNCIKFEDYTRLFSIDQKEITKLNQNFINSKNFSKSKSTKKQNKKQKQHSPKFSKNVLTPKYMVSESVHKSTVQFIRQKLGDIDRIIKRSKAIVKEDKSKSKAKISSPKLLKEVINIDKSQIQRGSDGQIQEQYEPIDKRNYQNSMNRSMLQYKSNKSSYISPQAMKKIWSPYKSSDKPRLKLFSNRRQDERSPYVQKFKQKQNDVSLEKRSLSKRAKRRIFQ